MPVRFSVDNDIQNRAGTVRLPPGYPTVPLRAFYGLLRVVYGLSAVVRSHENAGKIGSSLLSTPAPARLVKTVPGPLRIVGHPTGTLRVPHGNGQNYCFYSPYGALNGYVTAALGDNTCTCKLSWNMWYRDIPKCCATSKIFWHKTDLLPCVANLIHRTLN